jgi:hypothetical protein
MLHDMGFRSEIIERQLAHQERSKTKRRYNRALYLEERRQMMQAWADYLEATAAGGKVFADQEGCSRGLKRPRRT